MKIINLTTKKELEIFMNPCRQQILREMELAGEPVTAKYLSERVGVSPSSIQFHIKKLESLGLVQLNHTKIVNGIVAKYLALTKVQVNIAAEKPEHRKEREIIMENCIQNVYKGCLDTVDKLQKEPDKAVTEHCLVKTGVVFLSNEDAKELIQRIHTFVEEKGNKAEGENAWEFAVMMHQEV